ncbi:hypothetical protein WR25_25974 [Diploscapter pachys]|uniref:Large ribosomal subunit protein P2 n=1 Tax=Diploscapter pachys TaxID=2018661 RepID=A0A2A2L4J1_9BILA|nr:hypothetical protein WR25_25974 [Diploscapter pachys]
MKYVSAYMLAQIGGKKAPTHDDIHKILEGGGLEYNEESAKRVVKLLSGKSLADLIADGSKHLVAVSGGGGGAAAAPSAAAPAAAAEAPKDEGKKKKEEAKEESDDDMGFGLFD